MMDLVTFVARVGNSHWALLRQGFEGWTLQISGQHPLKRIFGRMSEPQAKQAAATAVREHVKRRGPERELAYVSELSWRIAVRYIAA